MLSALGGFHSVLRPNTPKYALRALRQRGEKPLFTEPGQGIKWRKALVRICTRKAIQVKRSEPFSEQQDSAKGNLLLSSRSQISAPNYVDLIDFWVTICRDDHKTCRVHNAVICVAPYANMSWVPPGTKPMHAGNYSWGIIFWQEHAGLVSALARTQENMIRLYN